MTRPITQTLLTDLFTGFKTTFRGAFDGVQPTYRRISTYVPSTAGIERYDWLGEMPRIREWIGDRVVKELSASTYAIENRPFESTVRVKRDNIEDDQLGIYTPLISELGRSAADFPDELMFSVLRDGFTAKCYDGQPFFDTEHPSPVGPQSNLQPGAGAAWYLLDESRAIKPLIFQDRRKFDLVALDGRTDSNVFWRGEYVYGVDGRCAGGYGLWQLAFGSKAPLDRANYEAARISMSARLSDEGRPLGVRPRLLVVPPALEGAAKRLLNADTIEGTTNEWKGTAELLVAPWLAA
jgi:phage major head subunit gpT-like protein